jgi:mannose/fructose/N-acetylgalactosamine-specific phosphotransferase system component IIC
MTMETSTGISVQNVIELANSLAAIVGILAIGFSIVGIVAIWRTSKDGASAFFRMFERMQILQMLTVMLVIASATLLALVGVLNSNGVTGILSGVAGYVLGGLSRPSQSETTKRTNEGDSGSAAANASRTKASGPTA